MSKAKFLIAAATVAVLTTSGASAQTPCGELCTREFWEGADPETIQNALRSVDADSVGEYRLRPLHFAARWGTVAHVRYLLAEGAQVNARDFNGFTPLILASAGGSSAVVTELLHAGADIAARSEFGMSALHFAANLNNPNVIQILLSYGASIGSRDDRGQTPLHTAAGASAFESMRLLLNNGADVNAQDETGHTPLHVAALVGHAEGVALLISEGANVHARAIGAIYGGETPLHWARGSARVLELLVAAGADVNAVDDRGETPLHEAALHGTPEMVMSLLNFGADGALVNSTGDTPFDRAGTNDDLQGTDAYWALNDARFR